MRITLPLFSLLLFFSAGIAILACTTTTVQVVPDRADTGPATPNGDDMDATPPADAGTDAHVAAPPREQIPDNGGPVVASPEIVTITWQGDTINDGLEAFDDWLVASDTWKTMMAEWGVGPGKHLASYRVPTAAPGTLDDSDVRKLLQDAFTAGSIPPPNGSRIYTVYPPSGTTVTSFGSKGCDTFQAYHSSFTFSNVDAGPPALAIYAITPRCDGGAAYGMQPLDYVTWGQSHEVMEASSDPDAMHPTWVIEQQTPATPDPGENADLCTSNPTQVDGHMITRNYSNAAAAKGERVCVPAPPGPDFGGYVDPVEITLKPGGSTIVPMHLYANGPMPDFTIAAYAGNADITVKQSAKTGNDGQVVMLTVSTSTSYVEQEGANLVYLMAYTKDYASRRALIVHSQ